jgi:hypothetical protein
MDRTKAMEAALDRARKRAVEVESKLGVKLETLRTDHFQIFTDWDPREYNFLRTNCEGAYGAVLKQFNSSTDPIVFGTLPIFMFSQHASFKRFTKEFDGFTASDDLRGYYMPHPTGFGHMAMWKPDVGVDAASTRQAELFWAYILTHEFTHAFTARYRSPRQVPRWLDEGVAEVVAHTQFIQTPDDRLPRIRARQRAKPNLIVDLLHDKVQLTADDYPMVESAVAALLAARPGSAFLSLYNDLKDGMPPEEALQKNYHLTYAELVEMWQRRLNGGK